MGISSMTPVSTGVKQRDVFCAGSGDTRRMYLLIRASLLLSQKTHASSGSGHCFEYGVEYRSRCGEVPEWPIGAVSKTVDLLRGPWVRIPPSPPDKLIRRGVRVAEGARLESVCGGYSTAGSNPALSATAHTIDGMWVRDRRRDDGRAQRGARVLCIAGLRTVSGPEGSST